MVKSEWILVKDKKGAGHHYSIRESAFDPEAHERLKGPGGDEFDRPLPPKYHVTKGGAPIENTESKEAPK